jgi:antitoxin component YwqK of YwqJK toxin-antitoxin module
MNSLSPTSLALSCALLLVSCSGAPPAEDQAPAEQTDSAPEETETAADQQPAEEEEPDEPESFCPEDAREIERGDWHYCKREGAIDGPFVYTSGGQTRLEGRVASDTATGTWTAYYEDGSRKWTTPLVRGEEEGTVALWYDDETPRAEISYRSGERHGSLTIRHENGREAVVGSYDSGKRTGTWEYFHENGTRAHRIRYDEEGVASVHEHWDEEGEKITPPRGKLPRRAILSTLKGLKSDVIQCYRHHRLFEEANGKIVIRMLIDYTGDVTDADIYSDHFDNHFLETCARRQVELLSFPENPYGPQPVIENFTLAVQ